ncbi:MAG TPA: class I SAM-dependent methyltransferase [Roseiarcus sp.]|nr:class I SAM-dependent methyltransferase [Roseiarcus sp.]
MEIETRVEQNYDRGLLEQTILNALVAAGKDPDRLTAADLAPVDEFHIGGREATVDLAQRMGVTKGMRVLDVGCGLGGASRYFAGELGCDVTGIDLTEAYVRAAEALTLRVGLAARVNYQHGSAVGLPFAAATFDAVYMMHVGMNIEDKARAFAEFRRVLAPGGVLGIYDVMREQPGELGFPIPWASDAAASFLATAETYRSLLEGAGFEVSAPVSRRDFAIRFFERVSAAVAREGGPPPLGLHILMGATARAKAANSLDLLRRGVIAPTVIIARAI